MTYEYDFTHWYQRRKTLWAAIQPIERGSREAWRDHMTLYTLMRNADSLVTAIAKEEAFIRPERKESQYHKRLVGQFEETVKTLEDLTVMYRLMHGAA